MTVHTAFEVTQQQLKECAEILRLDSGIHEILRTPMREIHVQLPVRMDDGSLRVFQGYRIQYNASRGPTKGGVRFHPDKGVDALRAQAALMTWKCALLDLPLGGACGGVLCNPKEMTRGELERLSRTYIDKISEVIGPEKDVPAPDVYTDPQIMAWMMDEFCKINQKSQFGVITGKPVAVGGSVGRTDANARGGMYALREAAKVCDLDMSAATVAVQGFGNAGYFAASLITSLFGCKVVAVSDTQGGIYNKEGLAADSVRKHKAMNGSVTGHAESEPITNDELLKLEVDILIPAALENVITDRNAGDVRAKIVAELSNGPTTPEADEILYDKGIHLIPDFLCNAGGVTVSYFEMVQNAYMYYWDREMVHESLDRKISTSYQSVLDTSIRFKINMRKAAYAVAVLRVVEAMKSRGWV